MSKDRALCGITENITTFTLGSHQTNTDLEFSVPQKVYHKLQYVARNIHPDELINQTFMPYLIKSLRNCIDYSIDWLIPGLDSYINLCLRLNKIFKKTNIVTWLINADNYQINYHIPESMLILKLTRQWGQKGYQLFCFALPPVAQEAGFASYFLMNLYNFPCYNQFLTLSSAVQSPTCSKCNEQRDYSVLLQLLVGESLEIGATWHILVNEKL